MIRANTSDFSNWDSETSSQGGDENDDDDEGEGESRTESDSESESDDEIEDSMGPGITRVTANNLQASRNTSGAPSLDLWNNYSHRALLAIAMTSSASNIISTTPIQSQDSMTLVYQLNGDGSIRLEYPVPSMPNVDSDSDPDADTDAHNGLDSLRQVWIPRDDRLTDGISLTLPLSSAIGLWPCISNADFVREAANTVRQTSTGTDTMERSARLVREFDRRTRLLSERIEGDH